MGDSVDDQNQLTERREAMLAAAAEAFGSPDYAILKQLSWKDLATRSNWSDKTITAEFGDMETLQAELIRYMTDRGRAGEQIVADELAETLNSLETSTPTALAGIAKYYLDSNLADIQIRWTMAMWPYAAHHNRDGGNKQISDGLLGLYEVFDSQVATALNQWIVNHDNIVRQRRGSDGEPYLSTSSAAALLVAVTEGLSIRYALDPDSIDPNDLGKAYGAILAVMLQLVDETVVDPTPALLNELDRRRGASDSSEPCSDEV